MMTSKDANTSVEDPMDRPISCDVFVVDNEVSLAPGIACEPINSILAEVSGVINDPIRTQDAHIYMSLAGQKWEKKTTVAVLTTWLLF